MFAFDLIEHDGADLRDLPLIERKRRLARLIGRAKHAIRFVEHLTDDGPTVFDHVCRMGLEGIMSKRTDAPYRSGPSKVWISPRTQPARRCAGNVRKTGTADQASLIEQVVLHLALLQPQQPVRLSLVVVGLHWRHQLG